MQLFAWLGMRYTDERLSWDPDEWGGITQIFVSSDEIWTPDCVPYNSHVGLKESFEDDKITVYSSGYVRWTRYGTLDVLCRFSGLVAFPRDTLKCLIEFGGWEMSGGVQGITTHGVGYSLASGELTSGYSYQEYTIKDITAGP